MMGFSVITTQLLSFLDPPKRVKLNPVFQDPHIGIGGTGMVDETNVVWTGRGIQGQVVVQFHQVDDLLVTDQGPGLFHGDNYTAQVADLATSRNHRSGKGP